MVIGEDSLGNKMKKYHKKLGSQGVTSTIPSGQQRLLSLAIQDLKLYILWQ